MSTVAICIPTCERPRSLGRLLQAIADLDVGPDLDLRIVVVDNDPAQSARSVVTGQHETPWPVTYLSEPQKNISLARNRAVERAVELGSAYLAFIDDDEVPDPGWLAELLAVQKRFSADVVAGPIVPVFDSQVPEWIVRGGYFDIPRSETGDPVEMAFTGNVLLDTRIFTASGLRFDPSFGTSGGEDSHFFMTARNRGHSIVWADGAVVREEVVTSRANTRWILHRAFRVGNCTVHGERAAFPWHEWLFQRLIKAFLRIAEGLLLLVPSLLAGRGAVVRALRKVCHGAGSLAAFAGHRPREYRVIHGG